MVDKEQCRTYTLILTDSLKKKEGVLEKLLMLTEDQRMLLSGSDELNMDEFEEIIIKKDTKLKELETLDQGFELIYEKVKDSFPLHKSELSKEINSLQSVITKITDQGVKLEAVEQENKRKLELYLLQKRSQIKNFKMSNKTVSNYYKSMSGYTEDSSYFMDKRK